MKTIYYAHSIAIYETPQEARDIALLEQLGFMVFNPNSTVADAGYKHEGMDYFKAVVQECDALAFRPNPGGSVNAGVDKEIQWAIEKDLPVIELPSWIERKILSVGETRALLRELGHR